VSCHEVLSRSIRVVVDDVERSDHFVGFSKLHRLLSVQSLLQFLDLAKFVQGISIGVVLQVKKRNISFDFASFLIDYSVSVLENVFRLLQGLEGVGDVFLVVFLPLGEGDAGVRNGILVKEVLQSLVNVESAFLTVYCVFEVLLFMEDLSCFSKDLCDLRVFFPIFLVRQLPGLADVVQGHLVALVFDEDARNLNVDVGVGNVLSSEHLLVHFERLLEERESVFVTPSFHIAP